MLKKMLFVTAILIIAAGLFVACDNGDNDDDQVEGAESYELVATINEIEESSILVQPVEGEEMLKTADLVTVSTEGISEDIISELEVGSRIRVFYTGGVMESYPAQLEDVENIEIIE